MSSLGGPFVFDASAILAVLFAEAGVAEVVPRLPDGILGAANLAEVLTKLTDRGVPFARAVEAVGELKLQVVQMDRDLALQTAALRPVTKAIGLSLGDRACLALGRHLGRPAVTADRSWAGIADAAGVAVVLIR